MAGITSKRQMASAKLSVDADTWRGQLLLWEHDARSKYLGGVTAGLDIISDCMDRMQATYPGKYNLVWANTEPNEYHLVIKFKDAKHETLWNLQYGAA